MNHKLLLKPLINIVILFITTLSILNAQKSSCDIKAVNSLIQSDKIRQAYKLSKEFYSKCHTLEFGRLYAKLAFWNKEIDTAYALIDLFKPKEKLYQQIYAAKIIHDLNRGLHPKIPTFLEKDYDVLAARIEQLIREHRFKEAYLLSRRLYRLYKTQEALQMQANLLFWMKRYHQSLKLFKSLGDKEKIKQIREILLEEKLAQIDRKITKAWERSEKILAKSYFDKLNKKEQKIYRSRYRNNACRVEHIRMLGFGYEYTSYSDDRYLDQSKFLEFTLPIKRFTIYGKIEDTNRYSLHDTKIYAEIYPTGFNGYWGYLSLSITPQPDFYSRYSIGAYLYKNIGDEELGVGYLYSRYSDIGTHLLTLQLRHYFNAYLSLKGAYSYEFRSRSYAFELALSYETPCHLKSKIAYLYSSAHEEISDDQILSERGVNLLFEIEYPFAKSFSLNAKLQWHQSRGDQHYNSKGISLSIRYYW